MLEEKQSIEQICSRRLERLEQNIDFGKLTGKEKEIIQALIKILVRFKSTDIDRLIEETQLSEDELMTLIQKVKYKRSDGKVVNAFQISEIRGMIKGIYLSSECGEDL